MRMGYTKLFQEIIMSTVWREPDHVRILWITMLALKDRWHVVNASLPGLADSARITLDECTEALKTLSEPDPHSRTKDFEGRRIQECDGGWIILNGEKYRNKMSLDERREYQRIKQQEYRDRKKSVKSCQQSSQQFTHTDTDTDTDTDTETIHPDWLDVEAWNEFKQHRKEIKKPLTALAAKKNMNVLEANQDRQREIIDTTIANRWSGLFAPKGNANGTTQTNQRPSAVDRVRAANQLPIEGKCKDIN